jgi:DNA-binding transcriptional LysR family regulator
MNTDVLKTFCDLVDTGSFSKAAEENYVSQSAVSQQLAKLERDLGTQLISRGGGLVVPTEAGKAFYAGAVEILRRYERLLGEVRSAADAVRGVLRVGTIYSVGFYLLAPYIRKFLQAHPEVNLHVEYTRWNRIYAAVLGGEMNLGVVACPEKHRSIKVTPLADEELVMVCSPEHRLSRRRRVRPADLKGEAFVAFEAHIPTRRHIDRLLKRSRVPVEIAMEFDNVETLKRAVEVNAGLSILPRGNVADEVEAGGLSVARFSDPARWTRRLGVIRRRGRVPSPAERMFLKLLPSAT